MGLKALPTGRIILSEPLASLTSNSLLPGAGAKLSNPENNYKFTIAPLSIILITIYYHFIILLFINDKTET